MNTCDTCKHLVEKNTAIPVHSRRTHFNGMLVCKKLFVSDSSNEPEDGIGIDGYVEDFEFFIPGPKFGCIHHELK